MHGTDLLMRGAYLQVRAHSLGAIRLVTQQLGAVNKYLITTCCWNHGYKSAGHVIRKSCLYYSMHVQQRTTRPYVMFRGTVNLLDSITRSVNAT